MKWISKKVIDPVDELPWVEEVATPEASGLQTPKNSFEEDSGETYQGKTGPVVELQDEAFVSRLHKALNYLRHYPPAPSPEEKPDVNEKSDINTEYATIRFNDTENIENHGSPFKMPHLKIVPPQSEKEQDVQNFTHAETAHTDFSPRDEFPLDPPAEKKRAPKTSQGPQDRLLYKVMPAPKTEPAAEYDLQSSTLYINSNESVPKPQDSSSCEPGFEVSIDFHEEASLQEHDGQFEEHSAFQEHDDQAEEHSAFQEHDGQVEEHSAFQEHDDQVEEHNAFQEHDDQFEEHSAFQEHDDQAEEHSAFQEHDDQVEEHNAFQEHDDQVEEHNAFQEHDDELEEHKLQSPSDAPGEKPAPTASPREKVVRASITPEIHTNQQYQLHFSLLQTQKSEGTEASYEEQQKVISALEETLDQFGIEARVIGIQKGPIITRYEVKIPPGIKVNRILSLTDELAMALEALRVRIEAPIPGRSTVGIEIPNKKRQKVLLGDILNDPSFPAEEKNLPLPLGKDISGNLLVEDLTKMPHILIAGATGSGKSVAVNSFITSLILLKQPEEVRLLMIDPKLVELSHYNDIPHLLHPVIVDSAKAVLALNWAVEEMERRYEDMAEMRARDITSYNEKALAYNQTVKADYNKIPPMPYIVVLIDELGDLMMVAGKEVENSIIRLAQKARAVGIHLILATQRPSVDVITALIKANCPARIALQVAQKTDSRTILDSNGGEQLLGQGDMLFKHPSRAQLIRAQAPFVADHEVEEVVKNAKKMGQPAYIVLEDPKAGLNELDTEDEELFDEAWEIIIESNKASASYLQRRLRIGYNRAARLIEAFEARGYIGPQIGSKPREILKE